MADTLKIADKGVLLGMVEANYGVDPNPTGASNAIRAEAITITPVLKKMQRNYYIPYMGARGALFYGQAFKLTFKTEFKGSGTAGTPAEIGVLFRGCNFTETLVGTPATKVDYDPNSLLDSAESITLYFYLDGYLHKLTGAKGTFKLDGKAGEYSYFSWEFTGIFNAVTDVSLPEQTLSEVIPPRFISALFTLDSYAAVIENFGYDCGNNIVARPNANAATGIAQYMVSQRNMTLAVDPEAVPLATKDWWGKLTASSDLAFTATFGASAGNKIVVSGSHAQLDDLKYGNRENILIHQLPLVLKPSSAGNDEVKFSFQ